MKTRFLQNDNDILSFLFLFFTRRTKIHMFKRTCRRRGHAPKGFTHAIQFYSTHTPFTYLSRSRDLRTTGLSGHDPDNERAVLTKLRNQFVFVKKFNKTKNTHTVYIVAPPGAGDDPWSALYTELVSNARARACMRVQMLGKYDWLCCATSLKTLCRVLTGALYTPYEVQREPIIIKIKNYKT